MHHNWEKLQQVAHQKAAQGWRGPVMGKECSSWTRRYLLQQHHRSSSCKFRKVSSSRTCQQTSRPLFGLCWWSGHTSVWVSSGDPFPVLGPLGICTVTSCFMAGITCPWCRTLLEWVNLNYRILQSCWEPKSSIMFEVSLGQTVWKRYSVKLCGYISAKPVWFWPNFPFLEHPSCWFFTSWSLLARSPLLLSTSCGWCPLHRVDVVLYRTVLCSSLTSVWEQKMLNSPCNLHFLALYVVTVSQY